MMAANSQPPTAFGYQHSSPLETLVRRTSSRRKAPAPVTVPSSNLNPQFQYPVGRQPSSSSTTRGNLRTPPREQEPSLSSNRHNLAPSSPLLHSHFSRGSYATQSSRDDNSYLDFSGESAEAREEYDYSQYYDAESVYSSHTIPTDPALRDSWATSRPHPDSYVAQRAPRRPQRDTYASAYTEDDHPAQADPYAAYEREPDSPVPMVVVSSPLPDSSPTPGRAPVVGKAPILTPVTNNFSRPVRPLVSDEELERRKLIVLQRNARQGHSPPPSQPPTAPLPSPSNSQYLPSPSPTPTQQYSSYNHSPDNNTRSLSPSSTIRSPVSPASDPYLSPGRPDTVHLSGKPPSVRPGSPASSLYSDYSYYPFDASPSPTGTSHFPHDTRNNNTPSPQQRVTFKDNSRSPSPGNMAISESNPTTPQDFLQLGITHHEANRLTDSASCFEKSATLRGGCGVGMLMWGLTLRHGWGCKKDEKTGFSWLRKAAELAVADLERMSGKQVDGKEGVRGELVLAIYEVGQCFFHGWGVKQDMKMGVSYYTTAARLGDPDAQNDLAFCLANGKGCKKDRKEAAGWYRKAVAQGVSEVGLAWIYKAKFQ